MSNPQHKLNLTEGLRAGDLKYFVEHRFTIDHYKSKMGADRNTVVIAFRATDKAPAIDLMEFIEKGYPFVLDADISAGEEPDGKYSVFVELQRTKKVPIQLNEILEDISQLCDIDTWRFTYYKELSSVEGTEQNIRDQVPLTPELYDERMLKIKNGQIGIFFNRGATEASIDKDDILTIKKPYAETLNLKLLDFGAYDVLKESLVGALSLDSAAVSQTIYLEKYLGGYEIHKLQDTFIIRNEDVAMIVKKADW